MTTIVIVVGLMLAYACVLIYDYVNRPKTNRVTLPTIDPESPWGKIREDVFARFGRRCQMCGRSKYLQVHHIIPISLGGTNSRDNLTVLCVRCHSKVHRKRIFFYSGENLENYGQGQNVKYSEYRQAILKQHVKSGEPLLICYTDSDGKVTNRTIIAKELITMHGKMYVRSFCKLRDAERNFRIDRIRMDIH